MNTVNKGAAKLARHTVFATIFVLSGNIPTAIAQDANQDELDQRLRECGAIAETSRRVACFDEVVNRLERDDEADTARSSGATGAASVESAESMAPAAAPATPPSPGASAPAAAAATATADSTRSTGSVSSEEPKPDEFYAVIVESKRSGANHFVVRLDNGQIWEETDASRRIGLPKVGSDVRVYQGLFGGYRMKIGDDNRVAWVRRLN